MLSFSGGCVKHFVPSAISLADVVRRLQVLVIPSYRDLMAPSTLRASLSFITDSILQHFHLYQFLLTQPQATDLTTVEVTVETPVKEQLSLQEAVEEAVWLKMKRLSELKAEFGKKMEEMELIREEAVSQADARLEKVYKTLIADLAGGPHKMSLQQVSRIVEILVKAHMDSCVVALAHSILLHNIELEFRIKRLEILAPPPPPSRTRSKEGRSNLSSPAKSSGMSSLK
jgi:hypothetical protein